MTIVAVGTDAALAKRFGLACHDAGRREGRKAVRRMLGGTKASRPFESGC